MVFKLVYYTAYSNMLNSKIRELMNFRPHSPNMRYM